MTTERIEEIRASLNKFAGTTEIWTQVSWLILCLELLTALDEERDGYIGEAV